MLDTKHEIPSFPYQERESRIRSERINMVDPIFIQMSLLILLLSSKTFIGPLSLHFIQVPCFYAILPKFPSAASNIYHTAENLRTLLLRREK